MFLTMVSFEFLANGNKTTSKFSGSVKSNFSKRISGCCVNSQPAFSQNEINAPPGFAIPEKKSLVFIFFFGCQQSVEYHINHFQIMRAFKLEPLRTVFPGFGIRNQ